MRRILLPIVLWLIICCFGCGQRPKIDIVVRVLDEHVVFEIIASGLNSINSFRIEDGSGNKIWTVVSPNLKDKPIEYGVLPEGAGVAQVYPPESKTPVDIRG